ncbi:MAG: hypothetical protein ACJ77K_09980 [Bacteroidia bacterium]
MKIRQLHINTLVSLETGEQSVTITMRTIFGKRAHEVKYKDLLVEDIYKLPFHNPYHFGEAVVFLAAGVRLAVGSILMGQWILTYTILGIATALVARFIFPKTRIYIPTKAQGLIRLYEKEPSRSKVNEFVEELRSKAKLFEVKEKKGEVKIDLEELLNR